jgi:hypothetical protein
VHTFSNSVARWVRAAGAGRREARTLRLGLGPGEELGEVLAGTVGFTTRIIGKRAMRTTGAKSFSALYGRETWRHPLVRLSRASQAHPWPEAAAHVEPINMADRRVPGLRIADVVGSSGARYSSTGAVQVTTRLLKKSASAIHTGNPSSSAQARLLT